MTFCDDRLFVSMIWPLSLLTSAYIRFGRVGPLWLLPYSIPVAARYTHCYLLGITGQGKSKLLEHLLVSDIRAGRGCGLVDPHTDLARDTLAHLLSAGFFRHPSAFQRVVYFDPTRTDAIIPFNVLKSPLPSYTIAQQIIEAFRRAWPQALAEAPRFTNIALVSLLVLIETGQSLIELPRLLTNKDYREGLLTKVRDPELVAYFHDRFDRWGREQSVMIESVLNKVTAFSLNPYLKRLLGAAENRLDFRRMMDDGQVLIVDLGRCDGETRRLVGSLVVTGLEMAAFSRQDGQARRPFMLFLDEFQDFCATEGSVKTLAQILSECRKFGLYLHLAHQTLGQLHHRLRAALGNVGVKVVFAVDREDAEVMAPKIFSVDTEAVKHEPLKTEIQYPLYSPLPEQWERAVSTIQELRPRVALVKRRGKRVVQMRTQAITPYRVSADAVEALMARLAHTHGIPSSSVGSVPVSARETARPATPVQLEDWEAVHALPIPTDIGTRRSAVIFEHA